MKPQGLISARVFINMDVMLLAPWCQATRLQSGGKGSASSCGLVSSTASSSCWLFPWMLAMCTRHVWVPSYVRPVLGLP